MATGPVAVATPVGVSAHGPLDIRRPWSAPPDLQTATWRERHTTSWCDDTR